MMSEGHASEKRAVTTKDIIGAVLEFMAVMCYLFWEYLEHLKMVLLKYN